MMQTTAVKRSRAPGRTPHDGHIRDPIDIPDDAKPTPEALRSLRVQAGLTKGEAAHIVGLNGKAASWHQYELGRYAIPQDKWTAFSQVLRSGRYPATCFASTRRGPRVSEDFQVGRMMSLASAVKAPVDVDGCARIRDIRAALRLSASALAAELGIELHRVYRIESETSSPSGDELAKGAALAAAHLKQLRKASPEVGDLRLLREDILRLSSTDAARLAGLKGSRPGATWSALESGSRQDEKAVARFRKSAAALLGKMQTTLTELVQQ
jgi:DNA-binding XRE family transcriptional regulator